MLALLRQRNFALLWWAGLISIIGDWMLLAALPVHVYAVTGSALATSLILITATVPAIVFGSLAGVYVDRWNRRRIMVVVNLLRGPLLLVLLLPASAGWLWVMYVVLLLESTAGQFFGPAENALLPRLVDEEQLVTANALNTLNNNLARLVGPSLGAATLAVAGLPGVVVVDSLSYLGSAGLIGLIAASAGTIQHATTTDQPRATGATGLWHEWRAGLAVVGREQVVAAVFVVLGVAAVADSFNSALLVPFVTDVLGGSAREFAWLLTAQAVSGMLAGALMPQMERRLPLGGLIAGSAASAAVFFAVVYTWPSLPLIVGLALLLGFPAVGFYVGT